MKAATVSPSALVPMPLYVGLGDMCRIVGMSKPSFRALVKDGVIPQQPDGSYDVVACVKAWHEWKSKTGTNPRRTVEEQRAIKLKRENSKAAGELMEIKAVLFLIQGISATVKMAFDSMPGRVAAIAAMQDGATVHEAVRAECSACNQRILDEATAVLGELEILTNTKE